MSEQCQAYYVLEGDMRCTAARGHAGPHCYECPPCAELLARLETATAALARMTEERDRLAADLSDLNTENHRLIARAAALTRAERDRDELELALQLTEPTYHRLTAELQEANERGDRLEAMCERLCCINVDEQMALRGKVQAAEQRAAQLEKALQAFLVGEGHCRYDHNQFCQEHADMMPCRVQVAREVLTPAPATPHGDGARDALLTEVRWAVTSLIEWRIGGGWNMPDWDEWADRVAPMVGIDVAALRDHPHAGEGE